MADEFIPEARIARQAWRLIEEERKINPDFRPPYQLTDIIWDQLYEIDGLILNEDTPLACGKTSDDRIVGKTLLDEKVILIDPSIKGEPFYRFTLAHEMGHWILHCQPLLDGRGQLSLFDDDTPREFVTYHRDIVSRGRNPQEIQANKFAAHLLMPEHEVREAFLARFTGLKVFPRDWEFSGFHEPELHDLSRYVAKLAGSKLLPLWRQFDVSVDAMAYRLEDLGLVQREGVFFEG